MAREGVVNRRTASRYIEAATSLGLAPSDELTDERVRGVAQCVQARPLPAVSDPRQLLELRRVQIEKWLNQQEPLTLVRIHGLLARDGSAASYATLRRWAQTTLGVGGRSPTVRVNDPPAGDEAQVDFGLMATSRAPTASAAGCSRNTRRHADCQVAYADDCRRPQSRSTNRAARRRRDMIPRKRATDTNDYPTGRAPYASRSVDALIIRARGLREHIGVYAERILAGRCDKAMVLCVSASATAPTRSTRSASAH
jgi:hypothetical protein